MGKHRIEGGIESKTITNNSLLPDSLNFLYYICNNFIPFWTTHVLGRLSFQAKSVNLVLGFLVCLLLLSLVSGPRTYSIKYRPNQLSEFITLALPKLRTLSTRFNLGCSSVAPSNIGVVYSFGQPSQHFNRGTWNTEWRHEVPGNSNL